MKLDKEELEGILEQAKIHKQSLEKMCEYVTKYTEGKYPCTYECKVTPWLYPCYSPEYYKTCLVYIGHKHKQKTTDWNKLERERKESIRRVKEVIDNIRKKYVKINGQIGSLWD